MALKASRGIAVAVIMGQTYLLRADTALLVIKMSTSVFVKQYSELGLGDAGLKCRVTHSFWKTFSGSTLGPLFWRALVEEGFM